MRTLRIPRLILLGALLGTPPGTTWAQTFTASIVGTITDQTGGVIPGAAIAAENVETGFIRAGATNGSGNYSITDLPVGEYKVTASLSGFNTAVRNAVVLQVGQEARLNFVLAVGAVIQEVTIRSGAPMVQTDDASIGGVIDQQKVVELPLNGREFFQLAQLQPNVFPPAQGSFVVARGGLNVAGNSDIANNFLLDGTDNNNEVLSAPTHKPSIDAIKEFRVMTGIYNAEYGRNSGAQVIVTTKSGTNQSHGTLFEFHRNSAFDANNFFSPAKPAFHRNQFGGTLGGPIRTDRTFFFGSYEGLRLGQQISRLTIVPTDEMKAGNFAALNPAPVTCRDVGAICDPRTGRPFSGNVIPPERFDRVGRALLAFYPEPNVPGKQNFASSMLRNDNFDQFSVKIDHKLSDKNNFFGSFSQYDDGSFEPSTLLCGTREIPGFGCTHTLGTRHFAFSDVHVLGPRLLHEFRFGYNRNRESSVQQDVGIDFDRQFGIVATPFDIPNNTGLPAVNVTGFATLGSRDNQPSGSTTNTFHWVDNLTYNTGTHALKTGVDIRHVHLDDFIQFFGRGTFNFTGGFTNNGLADLILGLPNRTQRSPGNPYTYLHTSSYDFYIQDDWKASSRLTVNAGLRYELNIPFVEEQGNNTANFDPQTGSVLHSGPDGFGDRPYNTDKTNWAPRLGVAWRPFTDNLTVVRAGFGVFYNIQSPGNGPARLYRRTYQELFVSRSNDPITLADPFPDRYGASLSPTGMDRNFRTAFTDQWSLNLQRELTPDIVVEVGYLGLKGSNLPWFRDINQPAPGLTPQPRPFPAFGGSIWFAESRASSSYHGLEFRAEKRSAQGLAFLASYTLSKSIDDSPGITTWSDAVAGKQTSMQDSRNPYGERGLSDFDTRHKLVFSSVYQVPFGRGRAGATHGPSIVSTLLGGWELAGIATLQSGRPFTPFISRDNSQTGNFNDRPNLIGDWHIDHPTPDRWLNTCTILADGTRLGCLPGDAPAWQIIRGSFGNAGRNILIGPGLFNVDLALMRNVHLASNKTLQLRAEVFNLFNRANFSLPISTVDSPRFGAIPSTATDPRDVQFGVKVIF